MKITKVHGYQVLDSRGRPTVAASIALDDTSIHTARVPSGASTGAHEAVELRDSGTPLAEKFYGGKSVFGAIANVNTIIAPALLGKEISLEEVDRIIKGIDPSENHSGLGANATLAVSLAAAKAEAHSKNQSLARLFTPKGDLLLPMPMVNILSGGAHANRTLDIQDVLVLPHGAKSFSEALSWIVAIRELAAFRGREKGLVTHLVADEGGLGIPFDSIEGACSFVVSCIQEVGLKPGVDVSLALDIASTQFFTGGKYELQNAKKSYAPEEFVDFIASLVKNQPIISIEDPFAEDDWNSWSSYAEIAPQQLQLLGDDLFTTSPSRLERGVSEKSANAILIKPNQNGLVSDTLRVLESAHRAGFKTVVSARSGETEDSWLADLATGWKAQQIKVGSTHGSERNAKWNRLLELEATEETKFAQPF
ncbi:MAG: phosphopyruvate hydratase [Candidatus Planktophila sp.]|jgi:enolase